MHNFLIFLISQKKCHNSFSTLLEDVVTHFGNIKESFNKARISIVSCQNDGDKGYGKFYYTVVKNHLPVYLEKYKDKSPQNPKMGNFDDTL